MATKVFVPRLGEGVDEVTVTKWLKQEGDSVNELEPLLEVNTDKVDTEIPAPATGTILKIITQEGTPAKVGELLAIIGIPGEAVDVSSAPVVNESKVESQKSEVQPKTLDLRPSTDLGFISPVVAKIAAEHGVDLSQVNGTGLNGRITKNDVLNYVASRPLTIDHRQWSIVRRQSSRVKVTNSSNILPCANRSRSIWSNPSTPRRMC
jgi:2-oxoglutarate dehydrogenase E2 component (dihydrolipoamide succinyltransferase)